MSHQNTAPWPTLPAPRTQAEADDAYADGGASPSRAEDWPRIETIIAAHPDGCPLPVGWSATDLGFRIRMDIYQSGVLGVMMDRATRVGEGAEAGKTWGESVQISLPVDGSLAEVIASAEVRTWTSGYTAAEEAEQDRRTSVLRRIQIWANSREAATIPWLGPNEGGRRDIADCLDAIDAVAAHPRRSEWIATVKAALEVYPLARPGLERCIRELGQAEVFGLKPPAITPLFILGAADAEMSAIENLLRLCNQRIGYATGQRGERVAPGERGLGVRCEDGVTFDVRNEDWGTAELSLGEMIAIEVAGPWGQPAIDHHDGSERASWGPERFLAASSIGQVIERLVGLGELPQHWSDVVAGIRPMMDSSFPLDLLFEAAADHCPAAAIAGLCPGVDPGAFAPFLAESKRAQYFPAMSAEDFARELATSRATLLAAPPCLALTGYLSVPQPLPSWTMEGAAVPADYLPGELLAPVRIEDDGDGDSGLVIESLSGMWTLVQAPTPDGTPTATYIPTEYAAVRDLRHLEPGTVPAAGSGEGYPSEFLVGIVAALFEGIGFVCRIRRRDGKLALRSNGHGQGTAAGTRPAEIFLADPSAFGCGPTQPPGQDASYGNPVRGFFGGTLTDQG